MNVLLKIFALVTRLSQPLIGAELLGLGVFVMTIVWTVHRRIRARREFGPFNQIGKLL